MYTVNDASVAQWIEQCPPEACAQVRLLSDAFFYFLFQLTQIVLYDILILTYLIVISFSHHGCR